MYQVHVTFDDDDYEVRPMLFGPFVEQDTAEECVLVLAGNPTVRSAEITGQIPIASDNGNGGAKCTT